MRTAEADGARDGEGTGEGGGPVPGPTGSRARFLPMTLTASLFGALCLLFVPFTSQSTVVTWAPVHSLALGLGLGCSLAGGALLAEKGVEWRQAAFGVRFALASCVLCALSGLAVAAALWGSHLRPPIGGSALLIAICLAACLFAAFALLVLPAMFAEVAGPQSHAIQLAACSVAAVELALACVCGVAWPALEVIDLAVFVVSACLLSHRHGGAGCIAGQETSERGSGAESSRSLEDFLVFAASFSAAFVFEELLRDAGAAFFTGLELVSFSVACLVCAAFVVKTRKAEARKTTRRKRDFVSAAVLACALVAVALAGRVQVALGFLALVLFGMAANPAKAARASRARLLPCAAVGLGTGMLAARLLSDSWYDCLLWSWGAVESQGSGQLVLVLVPVLVAIIVVVGIVALVLLLSIRNVPLRPSADAGREERQLLYLASQGLFEREAETLVKIAQGFTGFQISYLSHYSLGSVNGWRASGYRKLGLHSRAELIELLEAQVK